MKSLLNIILLIITETVAIVLPYIIMAGFLLLMQDEMNFKQAMTEVWDCPPISFCMFVWAVIVAFVATKDIWKIDC